MAIQKDSSVIQPALALTGLRKRFGANEVLRGIDLTANDGDVIAMIGASGPGKSTLLRCIPMLEIPDEGRVAAGTDSLSTQGGRLTRAEVVGAPKSERARAFLASHFDRDRQAPV